MTCNASKFQNPAHRAKLAVSGALSSQYPCFEGFPLQRMARNPIRRGDKVQIRRGAMVDYKGVIAPYKGNVPVMAQIISSDDEVRVAYKAKKVYRPTTLFGSEMHETPIIVDGLFRFFQRCGIILPGMSVSGAPLLVEAPSVEWMTHLSEWLTREQIQTLVLAGRIRYERVDGEVSVYLVAPGRVTWAGEKGYWREASVEDCKKVA